MSTNANLYFDQDLRLLILTVMESPDDVQSQLRVYALSFPPLTDAEYMAASRKSRVWMIVFISILVFLALASVIYVKICPCGRKDKGSITVLGRKRYMLEQRPNSICLFGGFSALDVNGNEVSFPYQQKKLLCLIIKYSLDDGISSVRLSKIMWPDKSEDKVKNSRGVAINHLRKLLDNFNGVSLVYENSHFKLQCSGPFSCDWMDFREESLKEQPDMDKVMSIVSRGKFLPFIDDPVFDSFKENTESLLISMLNGEIMNCYDRKQYVNILDLADVVFHTDSLNEQALICQLNALVKLKRTEDALVRYSAFVKEYAAMYDAEYEHDFKSLIK
jgi:two-component SAPR family response regulator